MIIYFRNFSVVSEKILVHNIHYLLLIIDKLKKAVDDNKIFSAIFIELSKTFDCICPRLPPELKTKNQNWIFIQYVGENYFWCSSIAQRSILFNNFYGTYFWNMKVIVSIITQAILINNKLKFELHVRNRKWIVNRKLNALARLTNYMELHSNNKFWISF